MKSKEEIQNDIADILQNCGDGHVDGYIEITEYILYLLDQFKPVKTKSIDERKEEFAYKVGELCSQLRFLNHSTNIQFVDYWTEHGENAKKMRFEKEKVFDIKKRLERWNRNQKPTTNGTTTSEALNKFITE